MSQTSRRLLALLLPSKGRWLDLVLTLAATKIRAPPPFEVRFFVCANYAKWQLALLRFLFSRRATFVDERSLEWRGMIGAYNYAFERASRDGAEWVALWADDLLPERRDWLASLLPMISAGGFRFGIFASDEGNHKGFFGWNVFAGYPTAHFFVARTDAMPGYLLTPRLRAYVGDNEIAISRIKAGVAVDLLPVRVIHQPTANATRTRNTARYASDLETFYVMHPELRGRLDEVVLRGIVTNENSGFIPDKGELLSFGEARARALPMDEFKSEAKLAKPARGVRVIGGVRVLWNEYVAAAARLATQSATELGRRARARL